MGGAAPGDSGGASHPDSGAQLTSKWRGSVEVFNAVVVMGKSWTRGHRGLYLKGKRVTQVLDFILNLISNRIEDPLRFC
jgi:hypothetical protein